MNIVPCSFSLHSNVCLEVFYNRGLKYVCNSMLIFFFFTGSISKYIDVILNFGASQITGDSLMHQLNRNHFRTVFYGDDTWLKLFPPETFLRYEGVSSFYVSDYTEVDSNVTRNVLLELKAAQEWDVMILHYLGLDHIGHIEHSFSPLIHTKLQEMDTVIEHIHRELIENQMKRGQNFLLVITGDHGMRDLGGHGGSTKSETLVPLITLGNDCKRHSNLDGKKLPSDDNMRIEKRSSVDDKVNKLNIELARKATQVDVTPTLAVLLGLPIPSCNTGKLIPKLLSNLTVSELLHAYYYNSKQITDNYFDGSNQNEDLNKILSDHYSLLMKTFPQEDQVLSVITAYSELLSQISSRIIKSSTLIDTFVVCTAVVISTLGTLITLLEPDVSYFNLRVICLTCFTYYFNHFLVSSMMLNIFVSYLLSTHLNAAFEGVQFKIGKTDERAQISQPDKNSTIKIADIQVEKSNLDSNQGLVDDGEEQAFDSLNQTLVSLMSMTVLCCLSTSYIENEHNVWIFVLNTFLFYILLNTKYKSKRGAIIVILVLHRFLRCINMKWLDEEASISCTLSYWFQMNSSIYLSIFHSISLISVYFVCLIIETYDTLDGISLVNSFKCNGVGITAITANMLCSFLYKTISHYQDYSLMVSLGFLLFYLVMKVFQNITKHTSSSSNEMLRAHVVFIILLTVLLFKPYNVVLISSLCVTSHLISKSIFPANSFVSILLHTCLGRAYYFLQGSTNSIATVDITVGYIGQTEYNSYLAGSLIYFNMYALNFLAILLPFCHQKPRKCVNIVRLNLKFISINLTFYLFNIYLQRHHLFIWSVFSPKLFLLSSYNLGNIFILILLYLFSRNQ